MRKTLLSILLVTLLTSGVFTEDRSQIAFNLLKDYVQEKERESENKTGAVITMAAGGLAATAGTGLWFFGDDLTAAVSKDGEPWDTTSRNITSGVLVGSGALTFGIGLGMYLVPPVNYSEKYRSIFRSHHFEEREALAAATIKDLADTGKRRRVTSGLISIAVPVLTTGATVTANLVSDREWHEGVFTVSLSQIWSLASGIGILAGRSEEERLYDKYRTAKALVE